MTNQMALPSAADFMTRRAAAAAIGVSVRTVERMVESGVLTPCHPAGIDGEELPLLLMVTEVTEVSRARRRLELGASRA